MSEETYDVIIVGGGPAGLTAGIYAARHGLKALLIESRSLGGRARDAHRIENFPGFPEGISGSELMDRFVAQAKRFNVSFKMDTMTGLILDADQMNVVTRSGLFKAKAVVIATGIQRLQLRVPGELEFKGRGVAYCSVCDGPFFAGKVVAVVGSSREAVEDALNLAEVARKVYAIPGSKGFKDDSGAGHLERNEKIEVIPGVDVSGIKGEEFVTGINLKGGQVETLKVDGVFFILEHVPTTDILREAGIETDESGCIGVDRAQQTNIAGVFAAGDCVCGGMQVVTSAGDGGKAGLSVLRYVKSLKSNEK